MVRIINNFMKNILKITFKKSKKEISNTSISEKSYKTKHRFVQQIKSGCKRNNGKINDSVICFGSILNTNIDELKSSANHINNTYKLTIIISPLYFSLSENKIVSNVCNKICGKKVV